MNFIQLILCVVIVIFAVWEASAGRYSSPLDRKRRDYEKRLKIYYLHNQPKQYLINKNCEVRLVKNKHKMYFSCKERTNGKYAGRYFEVSGNIGHVATMWAIIDMEFNDFSRYQDLKDLYYKLNQEIGTRGGLKYFRETWSNNLPEPELNISTQNEYCRMEILTGPNGEKALVCSEIWGDIKYNETRTFVINGDKLVLYGILSEFTKERDKMVDYLTLLYRYKMYPGCKVKELEYRKKEGVIQEMPKLGMPHFDENKPEPIKYIHVDFF